MPIIRYWYAEDIAEIMERMPPPGRKQKHWPGESLTDIAEDFGVSPKTLSNMLCSARNRGFDAYPLKSLIEFGGYPE